MKARRGCKFTVEGNGYFPFDMLRFDRCFPSTSEDAVAMSATVTLPHRRGEGPHRVTLSSDERMEPTKGRWASFSWHVREIEYTAGGRYSSAK